MDPHVQRWAVGIPPDRLYLSVMSIFELEKGILGLERRDPRQGAELRTWLEDAVLRPFRKRILPVDTVIAQRCAALHVPDPRPSEDALIAATALVYKMQVVTRNVQDYAPMGVDILNPWT